MSDSELQSRVVVSLFRGAPAGSEFSGIDARAWRTDAYRAARLAQAALEHLPVAATVLLAGDGAFEEMLEFTRSPEFVAVVEEHADLVASFGHYVRGLPRARGLEALLALDEALVDIGELPTLGGLPADHYQASPRCRVMDMPVGLAAWHASQFARLQAAPGGSLWERILGIARTRPALAAFDPAVQESLLVVRGGHGHTGSVETLSVEMAMLLRALALPQSVPDLVARFSGELSADDCVEILDGLIADGIVVRTVRERS